MSHKKTLGLYGLILWQAGKILYMYFIKLFFIYLFKLLTCSCFFFIIILFFSDFNSRSGLNDLFKQAQ